MANILIINQKEEGNLCLTTEYKDDEINMTKGKFSFQELYDISIKISK